MIRGIVGRALVGAALWGTLAVLPAEAKEWPVPVVITIDDGCPDALDTVAPALEKYGWRGCFNIIAHNMPKDLASTNLTGFTWETARELIRRGHEIETHATGTAASGEPYLADGSTNKVLREMIESCDLIEKATGVRPRFLCPHGQQLNPNGLRLMELAGLRAMRGDRPDHGQHTIAGTPSGVGAWIDEQLKYDPCSIVLMIHAVRKGCGYNPFRSVKDFEAYLAEIKEREDRGLIKVVNRYADAEPFDRRAIRSTPRWKLSVRDAAGKASEILSESVRPTCLTNGPNMWFRWELPQMVVAMNFVSTASGGARVWGWIENHAQDRRVVSFEGPFVEEETTRGWKVHPLGKPSEPYTRTFKLDLDGKTRVWNLPVPVFVSEGYDVCVVGGGVAGVAAALQAGRAGARTVLVEQGAMVGGNMTSGGVNWPGLFHAWGRQVIDGCGWELVTNCVAASGGTLPDFTQDVGAEHWKHQVRINAPLWVAFAEEALAKAGVEIRYHTAPAAAAKAADGWRLTLSACGETAVLDARVLVDATGNGTLAALCGGRRMRDATARQPGSFTYLINPHADEAKLDWPKIEQAAKAAAAEGRLEPNDLRYGVRWLVHESNVVLSDFAKGPDHGTTIANYIDGADNSTAALRTWTNLRGRASMLRVFRFIKTLPGLEHATLVEMSSEVGVRETWRVEGEYVLTGEDYVSGRVFDDSICYSFYPIDLHDAKTGIHPRHLKRGTVPTVPYRSLLVKGVPDLLVAGRCISSDRAANSALRVQATCMATGQAAGAAAALAAKRRVAVDGLDFGELKALLRSSGAIVP